MEQCPICKGEFDPHNNDEGWLSDDIWLCSEKCFNTFEGMIEGMDIERDMPEEFEPPDYLDDPEEEETEEDEEDES